MIEEKLSWIKENPWHKHYSLARYRCLHGKYKGKIEFRMSVSDFKLLWLRDKAWLLKRPSIDRKNNSGDYVLYNCRFIELELNTALGKKYQKKRIKQLTPEGKFIKEWGGSCDASRKLKIHAGNLCSCLKGKRKTAGGYKWILQNA